MKIISAILFTALALGIARPLLAADAPAIVPPPGWVLTKYDSPTPNAHMLGVWLAPVAHDGFSENINLLDEETGLLLDAYVTASRNAILKNMSKTLAQDTDEPCAAGTTAHRFEYQIAFGARTLDITQLIREAGGAAYIATYTRLPDSPADPVALTSLRTLCNGEVSFAPT